MNNTKITGKELVELEKDRAFKRTHISFWSKCKSWLYVAPVLLLLMSIFCILFLLKGDRLVSWYAAPYVLIFVVATIWFKAVRKTLTNRIVSNPDFFIVAFAKPVLTDKFMVYALFSTGANRHNANYIEHQASIVSNSYADLIPRLKPKQALPLVTGEQENTDCLYLCCLRKFTVRSNNIAWDEKEVFPLMLVDKKEAKSISL